MGGGKSQKGGKHGTIGRTLAHDILSRQLQKNELLHKNAVKNKEYSVYERSNLDDFTLAASKGLESYLKTRSIAREVSSNDINTQLSYMVNFPHLYDNSAFPNIPIPRRSFFLSDQQRTIISKNQRQKLKDDVNTNKRYSKRKNKKIVDLLMHGQQFKPLHGVYSKRSGKTNSALPKRENGKMDTANNTHEIDEFETESDVSSDDDFISTSEEEVDTSDYDRYIKDYKNILKNEINDLDLTVLDMEALDSIETRNFYIWRKLLSDIEQKENCVITPYEKNIEYWRQLWRVIERSHLIFIIIESRDPLFFRVPDLENYIKEVDHRKEILLILNKADFIPVCIRNEWADYFNNLNVKFVFFSTKLQCPPDTLTSGELDSSIIYDAEMLIEKIKEYKIKQTNDFPELENTELPNYVVGFIGFPNVGKSSLINCLMDATKTNVSSQPGKTKHLQTLILKRANITLCDCPGLIFPTLVSTKYHLLVNNIASTSHFKGNMIMAVQLICNRIPDQLCERYDVPISECTILANNNRKILFSYKFLECLCKNRNFISGGKGGQLDVGRAARLILDDYTCGNLLFCARPPNTASDLRSETDISLITSVNALAIDDESKLSNEKVTIDINAKTTHDIKATENMMHKWLMQHNKEENDLGEQHMTKRKLRFLIKGKRKN